MKHNPAYPYTDVTIAIDFDGVIHNNDKGYHDGTIYGELIDGTEKALQWLHEQFVIIIYTTKARKDRPKVNGKTGEELIWEYLNKKNIAQYIDSVTAEKPPAFLYIDDKGWRFTNWIELINFLNVEPQ